MTTSGPNLYDVLDVDPGASSDEIRDAWRAATADLTPADRRFRLYSQAAEVLLDDERRAAYDAQLATEAEADQGRDDSAATEALAPEAAEPTATTPEPAAAAEEPATGAAEDADHTRPGGAPAKPRASWRARAVPTWLLAAVAVLAVLSLALMSYLFTQPSEAAVEDAAASARSAAERAIVPVLSYDHRTLAEDQEEAHAFLTPDYRDEYDRFFEGVVTTNAERTQAVVEVEVVTSAVVRATEDRAEILLFVNRPTTNRQTEEPVVYRDQVRVRLEKVDGEWLVACLITSADGSCGS